MNVLVLYDSVFGNTEQIAQAIGEALNSSHEVKVLKVILTTPDQLEGVALLIVGSPTRGFRPTEATTKLIRSIPGDGLKGVSVAAFDTRFTESTIQESSKVLPVFVKLFGYAAEPIANELKKKGGRLIIPSEGFYVSDIEGPLLEGELERAADWAKRIAAIIQPD